MTSSGGNKVEEAYVWVWLPGSYKPVVAGRLAPGEGGLQFNYAKSYLERKDAMALYAPELPLEVGALPLLKGLTMPGCIRDASPDAWGRRVIINRMLGRRGSAVDTNELDEITYLLKSGSNRIGALDFQTSPVNYAPRYVAEATLEELLASAARVENGVPLSAELDQALNHGTAIGGARPKAQINDENTQYIAKFSSTNDLHNIIKAEFIAMRLAALLGLQAAKVKLTRAAGKDVLLVERFDRMQTSQGWQRKAMVSALTLFELDEMMARYASYETLAEIIRHRFDDHSEALRELFSRMVFNILCGNTDDHARNHAAFWDGQTLRLSPAYDLCPQPRGGNQASQAMLITGNDRRSLLAICLQAARHFLLSDVQARAIIEHQVNAIRAHWPTVCEEAELSQVDRGLLWERAIFNPYVFEGFR